MEDLKNKSGWDNQISVLENMLTHTAKGIHQAEMAFMIWQPFVDWNLQAGSFSFIHKIT
jgi:hypothetical protein